MRGDQDDPFTHDTADLRYRWCKCKTCGTVACCTPTFDFFIGGASQARPSGRPLECETCARARWTAVGVNISFLSKG